MHVRRTPVIVMILALSVPVLSARAKRARIESSWRESPVVVDGSPLEWPGPLVPFNDQPVSIAAANDGTFLYLVLTSSDRPARLQILGRGLIVWFDNAGGEKKRFGIKFPVGAGLTEEDVRGGYGHAGRRRGADPPSSGSDDQPPGSAEQALEPANRLELFDNDTKDARSFTADKAPGLEVKIGQAEGLLTYELKVPLARDDAHPYAVGAKPGATIGIGLEMPKLEMPEGTGREGRRGGMGGRGRIGGFGGMGGGREGSRGERAGFERPKPLSGWVTLQLSAARTSR